MKDAMAGMVTRVEFCDQLGIVPRTARNWAVDGYGPKPRLISNRIYYVQAEIDAFLADIRDTDPVVA